MTHLLQTLADVLTSPIFVQLSLASCAVLMARCYGCGHCGGNDEDDSNDADSADDEEIEVEDDAVEGEDTPDFNFNFSRQEMKDYEEMVEQIDARITELLDLIDDGAENAQELEEELVKTYLQRAARKQEEGEDEAATDDYNAAFGRLAEYVDAYGESLDTTRQIASARLNYGILLNDSGALEDADEQYRLAGEANEKLAAFGDGEAKLDVVGVRLNRASIAYELGQVAESLNMLDDAVEDFRKIAETDSERHAEALFYLAKTHATKGDILRAELGDASPDSECAAEAREETKRAVEVYRNLVQSGHSEYKRDLADAIVALVDSSATHEKSDLEERLALLAEACQSYEAVVAAGEHDACVDLFDATMQRGDLLMQLERTEEAASLYDGVIYTFEQFSESEELPLLEGLAIAYQRRAQIRKAKFGPKKTIADLDKAIEFQTKIAESLIASLGGQEDVEDECGCGCCGHDHEEHGCGCCGHDHEEHGCGCCGHDHEDEDECGCCGHDHEEHGCGCCGHDHEEHGCGCCGHDHEDEDECGCGCGCCGETERKFLLERWATDNFRALTECLYERACMHMELNNPSQALADCMMASVLNDEYHAVLKEGETLDSEFMPKIRDLKMALR